MARARRARFLLPVPLRRPRWHRAEEAAARRLGLGAVEQQVLAVGVLGDEVEEDGQVPGGVSKSSENCIAYT